jgi:membrane protease YdiL (CAAX protease family)
VLGPPLLFGAASIKPAAEGGGGAGTFAFVAVLLACGAAGEEILFRGYGFQLLLRAAGPYATILPVGILFAALHAGNPSASWLGLANTAGFGILFGWAFLRSQDLWLPIGLHYGWNFTLPVFGVNVSGIRMSMTGHVMEWSAGPVWSGGAYGPEASVLTSVVLAALFVGLWKSPIRRQKNLLLDPPKED